MPFFVGVFYRRNKPLLMCVTLLNLLKVIVTIMDQLLEFYNNHMFLGTATIVFAVLVTVSLIQGALNGSQALSSMELTHLMNKEDGLVIDLRAIADFNKGHIPHSRNIPFAKMKDSLAELEKYKETPMIMVCATGMQAGSASLLLRKAGFTEVHKLKGGIQTWIGDSLPLAKN